jgi:hypothetical protein
LISPALEVEKPLISFTFSPLITKPPVPLAIAERVASGTGGFVINGENAGDKSSISVSNAGDVNGDGLGDLIVGAFHADVSGKSDAGKSYVIFGKKDSTALDLS